MISDFGGWIWERYYVFSYKGLHLVEFETLLTVWKIWILDKTNLP
jgi:hypothetical protein